MRTYLNPLLQVHKMIKIFLFKRLQEFLTEANSSIHRELAKDGIIWHFIPARSPHFGGIWEAAVKSFKYHFLRVAGTQLLTLEELHTITAQTEAILNSRPLTPSSNDPNDFSPLTPAHFLIGDSLTSIPDHSLEEVPMNRLSRWQHVQRMSQQFWKRWSNEYLSHLQQRTKWVINTGNSVVVGDMVLLKDENPPPLKWKIGRMCDVHPGADGLVRVVSVKTPNSVVKLSVKKLCVLPIDKENIEHSI